LAALIGILSISASDRFTVNVLPNLLVDSVCSRFYRLRKQESRGHIESQKKGKLYASRRSLVVIAFIIALERHEPHVSWHDRPIQSEPVRALATLGPPGARVVPQGFEHEIFGHIVIVDGSQFTLQTRTRGLVQVDAAIAIQKDLSANLTVGGAIEVQGMFDSQGVLRATVIQRTKDSSDLWPNDF
jgi:hypothetical protein